MGEGRTFHRIPEHKVSHCHHCDQTADSTTPGRKVYSGSWLQGIRSIHHGNCGAPCLTAEACTGRSADLGRPERRESANQNLKQIIPIKAQPHIPTFLFKPQLRQFQRFRNFTAQNSAASWGTQAQTPGPGAEGFIPKP